jgi:tyrosine-protein phosphatase SIW14
MNSLRAGFLVCFLLPAAFAADPQGVGNFHQVSDRLYRGAQPTEEGFHHLAELGVTTVIDLREAGERSAQEEKVVRAAGMQYISVPMRGMSAPATQDVVRVLGLLENSPGPVFVHCRRGADRTGTVLACYRIAHDRWDNRKALTEARSLGMSWFERAMQSYVMHYGVSAAPSAATVAAAQ